MGIYQTVPFGQIGVLELDSIKKMDQTAVVEYNIPIELMMENAGLILARFISNLADKDEPILIGAGNGNNGGGGMAAARRLSGWGYSVYLDLPFKITKSIPLAQLLRAKKAGCKIEEFQNPHVWIDAYLGFSQRLPLPKNLIDRIKKANSSSGIRISLDIPTGYLGNVNKPWFQCQHLITLAALKSTFRNLPSTVNLYLADLGIPYQLYKKFKISYPPFQKDQLLQIIR